jgi:hypothetical protein
MHGHGDLSGIIRCGSSNIRDQNKNRTNMRTIPFATARRQKQRFQLNAMPLESLPVVVRRLTTTGRLGYLAGHKGYRYENRTRTTQSGDR